MSKGTAIKTPGKQSHGRKSYHHGDLRRALLDAAREEIAANGAQSLTLASLARRAGVAQSAPYRHFADRDDLLFAVGEEGFRELSAALSSAAESGGEEGYVRRMAAAYLQFGERNVERYRLMFASRLVPDALQDSPLSKAAKESYDLLLAGISARGRSGPYGSATAVWAQLHGLVMLKADGFVTEPLDALLSELAL
ncbi:transcriptional regulator [Burkholderia sp. Ch1-1]|uniref:Transcriptional regulator n=1 Tax=Paraburkholderia dioscoreae TaxID=2604047 RepID=A0A5Q4ZLX7_9BURK|nr:MULTISPECIES: TetR/AcrR family transcriptional regulator [Paraburkholderia]EIF33946.1 transcriptional regulator [Burkholderia sp. Ch1-1]MDR8396198.1 TetR/AcrR family transcriptional regulator [Paraburkholderia sp. USG1]VVD32856.1 Transcriptional regulator [Paraburkholderia dioscoreae]